MRHREICTKNIFLISEKYTKFELIFIFKYDIIYPFVSAKQGGF